MIWWRTVSANMYWYKSLMQKPYLLCKNVHYALSNDPKMNVVCVPKPQNRSVQNLNSKLR